MPADSASPVRIDGKYTLDGNLQAFTSNPFNGPPGPPVFDYRLKGSAKSTVRFGPTTGPFRNATSYFLAFR